MLKSTVLVSAAFALTLASVPGSATGQESLHRSYYVTNSFNLLAYNIFMRPTTLFANDQWPRSEVLPSKLKEFDAVVFSEAFDDGIRRQLQGDLRAEYPWRTPILGSDGLFGQDGGVSIISRWPITATSQRGFRHACRDEDVSIGTFGVLQVVTDKSGLGCTLGEVLGGVCTGNDCLADKGVLYARIEKHGRPFHVFASHTQSGEGNASTRFCVHPTTGDLVPCAVPAPRNVRAQQFRIIKRFMDALSIPDTEPVIIAGDFNVDKYNEEEFKAMLSILDASYPRSLGHPYTVDDSFNTRAHGRSYLDYVLVSNRHLQPIEALLETLTPRSPRAFGGDYDLSDHFPVFGQFMFPSPAETIVATGN